MAAELVTILHELVDEEVEISFGFDEEEDINVLVARSTFMRRKLNRNDAFFEVVVPTYSVDEFKSHFRMTRGTLEKLCREVAATGTIPEGNRYGRPPIPVQCQVLAFVWFMANSEVMRSVSDRFNITLSSLSRVIQRITEACISMRQQYIKWPTGTFTVCRVERVIKKIVSLNKEVIFEEAHARIDY